MRPALRFAILGRRNVSNTVKRPNAIHIAMDAKENLDGPIGKTKRAWDEARGELLRFPGFLVGISK